MSQCLRCSKLCDPTAVFCEECRSLLRLQLEQRPHLSVSQHTTSSTSGDPPTLSEHLSVQGDPLERITAPLPSNRVDDLTQPLALVVQRDLVEQAVTKLNEAAHLIEQEEEQSKSNRKPRLYSRASRLSPIVDISADIRRESTPLPKISSTKENNGNSSSPVDSNSALPDYWPWLDDETEDKESDIWANRTDPLISRRVPTSGESARIEEEDMRRALVERISTRQFPLPFFRHHSSRLRNAFLVLAIFALIAFIVDGILLNGAFNHSHNGTISNGYPIMTLSSNAASPGSKVNVTLNHFLPSTRVVLTHDIEEPITINGSSSITTDTVGSAKFLLVIDTTWGPGFHLIVAEDVNSRSTASANLQIIGEGTTPPAHLLIDTTPLAMGADFVGTNTIRSLTLANSGSGSISWSINSDASWLLVAPSQSIFSQKEDVSVAVQRIGLKPGDYHSNITISSNVSPPQHIEVEMSVRPLPPNAGPVLAVSPALLSFTATDGQLNSMQQTLTVSNPGSRPLNWSLDPVQGLTCNWLGVSPTTGIVPPGNTQSLAVYVQSHCLLPGAYTGTLTFIANSTIDNSQAVNVSMVVQPHCGLVTSTGFLAFTVVAGQTTLANQSLSLNDTTSCAGTSTPWSYFSTASWLSITPGSGQLNGTTSMVVTANVNAGGLAASLNPYYADLTFVFGQSTITVVAQLKVQDAPPMAPIMSASPLSLNFSNIQGQPNPTGQVVTITNNGRSPLSWHVTATPLPSFTWLAASPAGSTIAPGQSGQVTVKVNTAPLTPGNYVGQITLNGMDAKGNAAPGSPQIIMVNLIIQPPCTLSPPSSSALSFTAVQGAYANPAVQTVLFMATGSCVWPLSWETSVAPSGSWLTQTASSGTIRGVGQSGSVGVDVNITGLIRGTYSTTVTISASDANGAAVQGSRQTFTVTLTILPPCVLKTPSPATLAISLAQGQTTSSALNVVLSESGTCARPVTWHASTSSSWLALTAASGTDSGTGSSFGVNASAMKVLPGIYTGTITIRATDSTDSVVGNTQSLAVTLTVMGYTISGTVIACTDQTCVSSQPLPEATVTVLSGSTVVATTTANASGSYSLSNIPLGSYTITASGYDASDTHYTGSLMLTLSGDAPNITTQAPPG
jgi:Viral BACON domain/Carboxypeptidase regulatory-like domain